MFCFGHRAQLKTQVHNTLKNTPVSPVSGAQSPCSMPYSKGRDWRVRKEKDPLALMQSLCARQVPRYNPRGCFVSLCEMLHSISGFCITISDVYFTISAVYIHEVSAGPGSSCVVDISASTFTLFLVSLPNTPICIAYNHRVIN